MYLIYNSIKIKYYKSSMTSACTSMSTAYYPSGDRPAHEHTSDPEGPPPAPRLVPRDKQTADSRPRQQLDDLELFLRQETENIIKIL